jgi:hypothetical protein
MKLQRLQNRLLHTTGNLGRSELRVAFETFVHEYIYIYIYLTAIGC